MGTNIAKEIAALDRMTVKELRARHIEVFGEATRSGHKEYLAKRIAWRIQANAWGDLSDRAKRRADELANDANLRTTAPRKPPPPPPCPLTTTATFIGKHDPRLPMPGVTLRRSYKGRQIEVRVLPKGFMWEGQVYRSLSAVAKAITGTHWNGYHFFDLSPSPAPAPGSNGVANE